MKIRFYSDLHLEFGSFRLPPPDCKDIVLVLAGDIGVGLLAVPWLERYGKDFKAIIYVAGNHEYYRQNMDKNIRRMREVSTLDNFHFLENDTVIIDNVKFVGATLWTDLNKGDAFTKWYIKARMNDFNMIQTGKEVYNNKHKTYLTPELWETMHKQSVAFITEELKETNIQTVVVTHHAPTVLGANTQRYGHTEMTYGYYTSLEYLMDMAPQLTHWIFGHTHFTLDKDIFGTRVLSNPRGYVGHEVNDKFRPLWEVKL